MTLADLQMIFYVLASLALLTFITFLGVGIFVLLQIRKYAEELLRRAGDAAWEVKEKFRDSLKPLLSLPLIAFLARKILKKIL